MKIVVAYSGGLDTSVILKWIKESYAADVIAFCADIGQEEELEGLEEKALRTGASKCYVDDLREEFARDFIFPMFQASALYENQYFLGTSIARPLIAKRQVIGSHGVSCRQWCSIYLEHISNRSIHYISPL
jgi:argininosuccinate synthase